MAGEDKTAIVTGAASGIGSATCASLLESGYRVLGIDRTEGDMSLPAAYSHVALDITDFDRLAGVVGVDFTPGDVNLLVNCAGQREICHTRKLSHTEFRGILNVNTTSVFVASQAFCERLIGASVAGAIVNVASVAAFLGEPNRTAYVTSKHAVIGLTKQFAVDYAQFAIRANAVAPGVIRTPLTEQYFTDDDQMDRIRRGQLVADFGTTADVVRAIRFLSAPDATFVTGSTVFVDGGWSASKVL
ncbi:SDR family NAD(P)-dependent oxidoreductase [Streptomyces sp. NPDC051664]|uniref:SDR family NAD(P)-dependent oxidoreductase n=1 Tax=Streptomyces sp. NPDC051664 TaxID=3365668 RepID=UPI0037A83615